MNLQIITIKDIENELKVGRTYAQKIYSDLKEEYKLKTKPTKQHLIKYLRL